MKKTINFETIGLVKIEIERSKDARYFLSAKTESGFDLCNMHNGYLKWSVQGNDRLRSEKSIQKETKEFFDAMVSYIEKNQDSMIVDSKMITTKIFSGSFNSGDARSRIVDLYQVKSKTSGVSVSWYNHDIFKDRGEITVEIKRCEKGYLEFFANDSEIYDLEKLKKLAKSNKFKDGNLAFFRYEEAKRLLGQNHESVKSMSGLFA